METAVGAANWLLGKVLAKLSDDLVAAYVSSKELGLNFHDIQEKLLYTQALLHASQGRDVSNDPGLYGLLEKLSKKADEAEDMLDELHYFMIQDQLDDTKEAAPELGGGVQGPALHVRHAARHTIGNWIPCFSCSHTQDSDSSVAVVTSNPQNATRSGSGIDGGPVHKLSFDRVDMSNKIKLVIEELNTRCGPVSVLLKISNHSNTATSTPITHKRPPTSSVAAQDKLYGRGVIFEQTISALTGTTYLAQTLSVLPFVGPGGMGKTTFTQHLYNDKRVEEQFTVRVWVCVSTDFDVINLTRQILGCIPAIEKEEHKCKVETASLDQLQKSIAERLKSKRFLIVLDDIWKCNSESDWNSLLAPFKQGEIKGSMVLVTTRFPSVVQMVKTTDPVELHGLEADDFFKLFQACIFVHNKPGHYEDDLIDVAKDIAKKLKGSPLAANTVGRLLRKNISQEYWMEVLEKDEWQNAKNTDDILPSLKISYDYLPFLLKKCFSYCALFPEDYKFYNLQITSFWTAIGILNSSCQHDKNYLEQLVDNGFLMKGVDSSDEQYYVMHDLLHELSQNVSSQECVNISRSNFSADNIPRSIRHLSITIEDICGESFEEEMGKLKGIIDICNLRTLMIFGSPNATIAIHSNIPVVGKMKCLHELKEFHVKKEGVGFELKELGELRELKGKLTVRNLETVATKGEASEAKLRNKINLKELKLVWGTEHRTVDDDVLEGLEPYPDLRVLRIQNPGVATCPTWLCDGFSSKRLESLHLEGLSWDTLPPFEQLPHLTKLTLKSISGMRVLKLGFSTVTGRSFMHLKTIDLTDMPELVEWVGEPNSHLFSRLESITLEDCPSLCSFPFLEYSDLFTNLFSLHIKDCPKLSRFPPMPHTSTLSNMQLINHSSSLQLERKKKFTIEQYDGALAFHNLDEVEDMSIEGGSHISFSNLKEMNSLRSIQIDGCDDMFSAELDDTVVLHSVQNLYISRNMSIAGDLLSEIARSKLMHACSFQLEEFMVDSISAVLTAPVCSHLAANLHTLNFSCDQWVTTFTEEQEQALQLLTSLKHLGFENCKNMQSLPQGLCGLSSLKRLAIFTCKKMQCLPPKEGFPASLERLRVVFCGPELNEQARKLEQSDPWFSVNVVSRFQQ
ncbi:putative disease resistance protein RGA4 [Triticum dicoccoides]|uniref:putative disease resistance protein RGA4 n=1 Tax=Triticum dicoccoides TaxID=85692 RepID=UPI001891D65C|nr:putative disease resistance protein RGA4 [Triticum dicoccoides]